MVSDARRRAEEALVFMDAALRDDMPPLPSQVRWLADSVRALLAAEPAKGACADCGGCGGLGWIPAGDEQLGCIDCNGKGTIDPAPPAGAEVREAAYISAALMAAAREIGYIHMLAADPLISTKEGTAVIALAEKLLGPMSEWGERPDAHTLLAALRGGQKGGGR